jgi:hypothetical protein
MLLRTFSPDRERSSVQVLRYVLLLYICTLAACKEKSTEVVEAGIPSITYTTSHCLFSGLGRRSNSITDSICTYSFVDTLILYFSVAGNCCPDSNRFVVNHEIHRDTILFTVTDTAQNNCRCNCLYMIHTEVSNLSFNRYVVRCRLENDHEYFDPIHLVIVSRSNH